MDKVVQMITIEIAHGNAIRQHIEVLSVPIGCTVEQALLQSVELKQQFPEIQIDEKQIGIFGKHATLDRILTQDDRIEIYRPLKIDPKDARRFRASSTNQTNRNASKNT